MGKATLFSPNNGAQITAAGSLYDSTGALYQRYLTPTYQTSSTTAAPFLNYLCNTTSAAFTMTLPVGAAGSIIRFTDDASTWATNNLTIAPAASQTIQGISSNGSLVCNLSGAYVELAWDSTNSYWVVTASGFQYGPTYLPGVTGGIIPSSGLPGVTTNTTISAGTVGEVKASGSIGSGQNVQAATNLGSLALTAGNWLLFCSASYNGAGGNTYWQMGLTTNSSPSLSGTTLGIDLLDLTTNTGTGEGGAGTIVKPVSLSGSQTYYLCCTTQTVSAGNGGILGSITAYRIA